MCVLTKGSLYIGVYVCVCVLIKSCVYIGVCVLIKACVHIGVCVFLCINQGLCVHKLRPVCT